MNFWNNPENDSLKIVLLVLVVGVAAFFVFNYMHTNSLTGKGQVVDTQPAATVTPTTQTTPSTSGFTFSTKMNGALCTLTVCSNTNSNQCVTLSGKADAKAVTCTPDETQATPEATGLVNVLAGK